MPLARDSAQNCYLLTTIAQSELQQVCAQEQFTPARFRVWQDLR